MKIFLFFLISGACLSNLWAIELENIDQLADERVLEQPLESEETSSEKFSELVKSTMTLMGPNETMQENQ